METLFYIELHYTKEAPEPEREAQSALNYFFPSNCILDTRGTYFVVLTWETVVPCESFAKCLNETNIV